MKFIQETERRTLTAGVTYSKNLYCRENGDDVWVYITTLSPNAQARPIVSACPKYTAKLVIDHAKDHKGNVLYAMNASYFHFFNNGDLTPYGIQITEGIVHSEPGKDKERPQFSTNFFAVTKEGKSIISNTDDYYAHLEGNLEYAVGGGLILMKDGKLVTHDDATIAPRTAVAITKDGTVIFLCADGRSKISAGLTFDDLVDIYLHLGHDIQDLLNLDGGGSTTVVLREADHTFSVHNVPSGPPTPTQPAVEPFGDTQARPIADAILIIEI